MEGCEIGPDRGWRGGERSFDARAEEIEKTVIERTEEVFCKTMD